MMACFECGNEMKKKVARMAGEYAGEEFAVKTEAMVCPECGYKTLHANQLDAYYKQVADAYRKKHGRLTSDQIRAARMSMSMSQHEFAKHLGVGEASVKRWELGKVQDEAMDQLIRLKTDYLYADQNRMDVLQTQGGPEDEFSGWRRFSLKNTEQAILFFLWKLEQERKATRYRGPLVVNKLLWYGDAEHVKRFGASITGIRYARINLGPVPDDYAALYRLLHNRRIIEYTSREQLKATAHPTTEILAPEEQASLERTWARWKDRLNRIVDASHQEKAWRQTPPAELISFELVR